MFTEASSKGLRDGSKAEGFSPHRTDNQGGHPPYLRAADGGGGGGGGGVVPAQGGVSPWALFGRRLGRRLLFYGAHPLGGGRTGYGCWRQPPTMRHKPKEGATDCAHIGWGEGGIVC